MIEPILKIIYLKIVRIGNVDIVNKKTLIIKFIVRTAMDLVLIELTNLLKKLKINEIINEMKKN